MPHRVTRRDERAFGIVRAVAIILALVVCLSLPGAMAQPADASKEPTDEFGVSLSATPPPCPPGYATQDEAIKAALSNKVPVLLPSAPVPLPAGVVEQKDVQYGKVGDRALLLNLYSPEKIDKPAPGLIFIHGGGWTSGNRTDYTYYTVRYAKRGYVVATISYRFSTEAPYPAAVEDAKCAVRWMRANASDYHVDPDKIAVIGGSAGGYLSMMVGYTADVPELEGNGGWPGVSSRVQAVVDFYGPGDLDNPMARNVDVVTKFLAKPYEGNEKLYEQASPYRHISKKSPPTLIFQGTIDDLVPTAQSDLVAEKLKEAGVPCEYVKFEGWPHTMDIAIPVNVRCQWFMNRFFEKYLRGGK